METINSLEFRMYFFVNYQLMGIQKGIQCGHAAIEYSSKYGQDPDFINFVKNWKTWIILNGGTTNNRHEIGTGIPLGNMNQILEDLQKNTIPHSFFQEPDLNDALTAICFIADERVWNRKDYPDFVDYLIEKTVDPKGSAAFQLRILSQEELIDKHPVMHKTWMNFLGGEKNVFLRELITNKKLA